MENQHRPSGAGRRNSAMKRRALPGLLLFVSNLASAADMYLHPAGTDAGACPIGSPCRTISFAHGMADAGETIFMRGGTYSISAQNTLTRSGGSGNTIKLWAFPGESPVLDASTLTTPTTWVIRLIGASWWHIKGLEIKNHPQGSGINILNAHNNIIENNNVHHNGNNHEWVATGISIFESSSNNLILNNDSHHNRDINFGDGSGISQGGSGPGNVLRGNRTWRNSDNGIDLWNGAPTLVENNWSWANGFDDSVSPPVGAAGVGFKLGGQHPGKTSGGHAVRNNLAWGNKFNGFDENSAQQPFTLYNNTAWNNLNNYAFWTLPNIFRNNINFGNLGNAAGSATFNSWTLPIPAPDAFDFQSLDDTCAQGPRQPDGSLPVCSFLKLASGSDLIDKGTDVGIAFQGSAPDLGAFESGASPDTTAPTVSVTAPLEAAIVSGAAVAVTATAADAVGVVGVQFKLDGTNLGLEDTISPYAITWDSTAVPNGAHTITAVARDAAGNSAAATIINITASNGTFCTQTAMNMPVVVSDTGFAYLLVGTFGTAADTSSAPTDSVLRIFQNHIPLTPAHTAHATIRSAGAGRYSHFSQVGGAGESLRFSASDNTDPRINGRNYTFCVPGAAADTTDPTVTITAPSPGTVSGAAVVVSANAADNVGVVGVQFQLDAVNLGAEDTTAPYSVSWNTLTATNASHALTAIARDAAGNDATSVTVTVTVSNDASVPVVAITAPTEGATVSGSAVAITATASDDVAVIGVQFLLDGAPLGGEDLTSTYGIAWDTRPAVNGTHVLTAVARDAVGNATTSASVFVTVNNAIAFISCTDAAQRRALRIDRAIGYGGLAYLVRGRYGIPPDTNATPSASALRLFEDTLELEPGHAALAAVQRRGAGFFSHWSMSGGVGEGLWFSSSDGSDPRSNRRVYSYCTEPPVDVPA